VAVRVFVCVQNIKTLRKDSNEFFEGVGRRQRNNCLDFGGYLNPDRDPGIFFKDSLFTTEIPTDSLE